MKHKEHRRKHLFSILLLAMALFFAAAFPIGAKAKTYRNFGSIFPKANKQVRIQVKKHRGKVVTTNNMDPYYAGLSTARFWVRNGHKHMKLTIYVRPEYLHLFPEYHPMAIADFLFRLVSSLARPG